MFRRLVLAAALATAFADASACEATINVYPIRPNTALYVFPGFTQQLITANLNNSWRVAWQGGSGVTHFSGKLRDRAGGTLVPRFVSSSTTVTRPSASEIDFEATWDSSQARGADYIDFQSASTTVIIELNNDSRVSSFTTYPKPDLTEGYPIGNPFAMTLESTGGTISDPAVGFCDDFE
jgi:hypothetical protein